MKSPSPILFAKVSDLIWIRVDGKGSFEISGQLQDFVTRMIQLGHRRFVLDLDRCQGMDSTFMGGLLGISKEIGKIEGGLFDLVNVNGRNLQLLRNLGLTSFLTVDEEGERWLSERSQVSQSLEPCKENAERPDKHATAEVMLAAHEALAAAQPENAARFEDVIRYLKEDLNTSAH